jgi:hypothetical protein
VIRNLAILVTAVPLVAGCGFSGLPCPCNWFQDFIEQMLQSDPRPLVNVQLTEYRDPNAFARVLGALEQRGIIATILTKPDFVTEHCATIQDLYADGCEIMAFARPETAEGESTTLSELTSAEQEAYLTEIKSAVEDCLGIEIAGFRCTRFDQNEDTYAILDTLDFAYNLGFVAHTERCLPGMSDETLPYRVPEYDFWAVPMHSVYLEDEWVAFCDNPLMSRMEPAEWGALLKSELDRMSALGHPLLMEVHPYNTGADDDKFAAFEDFLDYAIASDARFITIAELVEWTAQQSSSSSAGSQDSSGTADCSCD